MGIYKIGLDKRKLSPIIRQTDSSISLSFFPAHNLITPDYGARCVHGFSVGGVRPFCVLAAPAFGERGCPKRV